MHFVARHLLKPAMAPRLRPWLLLLLVCASGAASRGAPIPIKVVVVTTFEEDTGPQASGISPGEGRAWIQGLHLDQVLPLPGGFHPVRLNGDGVLELMTGMATARAAASTMALGLDPRFDLTHAYWLLAGIAGVDPQRASLASAAWAEWVVDGDITSFVDPREIPAGWPDGRIPWDKESPFDAPGPDIGQVYHLNPQLVHWAFELTRQVPIPDSEGMRRYRARFTGFPAAQRPPFVLIGDNLASATYWQGTLAARAARRWVALYTGNRGTFTTTSCEDAGFMQALTFLGRAGRADLQRVMILRTVSDYCAPPPGMTSVESLQYGPGKAYLAMRESFRSAYLVGSVVVRELVGHWHRYRDAAP
jgi:purine nucleoside permease